MGLPIAGWANKGGTGERSNCKCGTWKQHWINCSGKTWPIFCSVEGCSESATLGGHIYNSSASGEYIAPMCSKCNRRPNDEKFSLKGGINLVGANKAETCEKPN